MGSDRLLYPRLSECLLLRPNAEKKKKEPKLSQNVDNVRREQNEMLGSEQNDEEEKGK